MRQVTRVQGDLELRKLQRTADGTYFVTLPKSWVSKMGVDRGAILGFSERRDGKIVIAPYGELERRIDSATLSPSPWLEREIEEKYLLGYDVIIVESADVIHSDVRETVKRILKKLVGLEIVEEDAKKIVIQCLIEPSLLIPEKILRRLHLITLAMEKDSIASFVRCDSKLASTVVERDEEVDRLYFLLVRVVRTALTNPSIAEKLGATPIDCLDYRILASFIENFADYSATIADNTPTPPPPKGSSSAMHALEKVGETVNVMYRNAVEAVLSRNLKLTGDVTTLYEEALENLRAAERVLASMQPDLLDRTTSVISALKAMCGINVDIADLAITR